MLFIFFSLIVIIISVIFFRKYGISNSISKGVAIAIALSFLAVICLAQNYIESLIPEINDGIGISNKVAYWIIGEDGWSIELFRKFFENSVYLTLFLIIAYPIVFLFESKLKRM
ncbi:hypothetical protein [Calidifontibacillus erzurumensis]|uniref:hypothetical protein n=1 Tax=Calidifontibacillus erzurumensis TaxID=2741433 RepID=UPI0035B52B9A